MLYRSLGRTGLKVSLVGLGTGGAAKIGQAAGLTAAESHRVVHAALDLGINLVDTSPAYDRSEQIVGAALQGVSRDRYILATKFGPYQGGEVIGDPQALVASLERSLKLLGVDHIDILQYHGVRPGSYRQVIDRFHPVALRAQERGLVRFLGITETCLEDPTHDMLPVALGEDLFDTIMVKYGVFNQQAENRVLPAAEAHNVGVLVMASVRQSLRNPAEAVSRVKRFIDQGLISVPEPTEGDPLGLAGVPGVDHGLTWAAYQFAAQHPAVSTVLVGTGNVAHLSKNVSDITGPGLTAGQTRHLREAFGALAWPS